MGTARIDTAYADGGADWTDADGRTRYTCPHGMDGESLATRHEGCNACEQELKEQMIEDGDMLPDDEEEEVGA